MTATAPRTKTPHQISGPRFTLFFGGILAIVFLVAWRFFGIASAVTTLLAMVIPLAAFILFAVWFFRRLGAGKAQSGLGVQLLPWDVVWSAQAGQEISVDEMFSQLKALPDGGQPSMAAAVNEVSVGSVEGVEYHAVHFNFQSGGGSMNGAVQVAFRLPRPVAGTILCHRVDFGVRVGQNVVQLESVEFNRGVLMSAQPRSLPWQVFPPDFMDWYLETKPSPSFFLNHDRGILLFLFSGKTLQELRPAIEDFINKISTSGALAEKSERGTLRVLNQDSNNGRHAF